MIRANAVAAYVVQHDHNPTLFFTGDAERWTTDITRARQYRVPSFALRTIVTKLNGKGYIMPVIMHRGKVAA